jgi:hypothetical protein
MKYIKDTVTPTPNWTELSGKARLVSDGARNFPKYSSDGRFEHIGHIVQAVRRGDSFPPLIAVQHDKGHLVLVEGLSRATAYAVEGPGRPVEALVGSSPSMNMWAFY